MASYHEIYESRPSRRNNSYPRPRDEHYLKPTTGTNEPRRRSGERVAERQAQGHARQPSPYRYTKDPRYDYSDYPPPLPPDTGPPPRQPRSPNRRPSTWPPQPICEDEAASLAKEAGTQHLLNSLGKDEARSRGTIDQETLIEDVPEYINQNERRFVLSSQRKPNAEPPTPPTSEDEKARKARRRPSKLDMSFNKVNDGVPELNKRPASPYSFSKPSAKPKDVRTSDQFLAPTTLLSPPPIDPRSRPRGLSGSRSQPSSPRRERGQRSPSTRLGDDYFSVTRSESAIDDTDSDHNRPATYPPSRDVPKTNPQTSVVDFAPRPQPESIRKRNLDARRNTDTPSTLPTMSRLNVDKTRRPNALMGSSALSELDNTRLSESPITLQAPAEFPLPRSREASHVSSRAVSPAGSAVSAISATSATGPFAPQRSPGASGEFFQDRSVESSPVASRNGSVTGSRPSSPSPRTPADSPRLPRTDLDWSALLALNAARRPKPPSRLSAPSRQESTPGVPRVDIRRSPRTDSLPYPMDDGPSTPTVWMPSERTHQYYPDTKAPLPIPSYQDPQLLSRSAEPGRGIIPPAGTRLARPSYQSRHSTAELPQVEKRIQTESSKAPESRRVSSNTSSQARKDLQTLAKKGLPDKCERPFPIPGYTDWYTLIGAPNLNFCPGCIDSIFERTVFRNYFRKSPPHNRDTNVQCALGGLQWIQLAYLFTLQQQRADLNLLKDIAELEESHPEQCPGDTAAVRSWYGVRDADGTFVKNFYICYSDVRKVERLLPTLNGLFVRHPYRVNDEKHVCAIRAEGNRFATYIDALVVAHEKALDTRKEPDPTIFIETVKRRQRLRECTKDSLVTNGLWHFMPNLPEFTVCEDCYEAVIEPHVQKNNDLAMRFHRTIQPAYGAGPECSCQLYSHRMRLVWDKAIRYKDFKYLARKAQERRDNELRLLEKYRQVQKKADRLSSQSGGSRMSVEDADRFNEQIADISAEWKTVWE